MSPERRRQLRKVEAAHCRSLHCYWSISGGCLHSELLNAGSIPRSRLIVAQVALESERIKHAFPRMRKRKASFLRLCLVGQRLGYLTSIYELKAKAIYRLQEALENSSSLEILPICTCPCVESRIDVQKQHLRRLTGPRVDFPSYIFGHLEVSASLYESWQVYMVSLFVQACLGVCRIVSH